MTVERLYPEGDAAKVMDWTPSTGVSNWVLVDDPYGSYDTDDYLSSYKGGDTDEYDLEDTSALQAGDTIDSVKIRAYATAAASGTPILELGFMGGSYSVSDTVNLTGSYAEYVVTIPLDPYGNAWSKAELDASTLYIMSGFSGKPGTGTFIVAAVNVEINYTTASGAVGQIMICKVPK